ncbi:MAG: hypothetical protein AAF556_04790 [Pseudomonadota bacterium]
MVTPPVPPPPVAPKWWLLLLAAVLLALFIWFARDVTINQPGLLELVLQLLAGLLIVVIGLIGGGPPAADLIGRLSSWAASLRRR